MRPQQQNRRMRGRNNNNNNNNNNNRKGPNPLTRSYESNGPDVKIRGSAQQIADKYMTLGRDAQSAGDRVMAENYLQHAEHYNRIIAAAQAQMPQQQVRDNRDDFDDDDEERDEAGQQNQQATDEQQQRTPNDGSGPQPYINGTPAEVALNSEAQPEDGGEQRAEQVNGNSNGNGAQDGEEGGQRRSRRSRRGRGRPGQDRGIGDEQAASGEDGGSGDEAPAASAGNEVPDAVS